MDNLTQTGVIRDELVRLIKVANPGGPNWTPAQLSIEYKSYDAQTDNNTIWVRDLTNQYFSYRDFEYHRVEFSLLFKGISPMVQVRDGETVSTVLKRFCVQYGLPAFLASDFEDTSLFTQTVHLIDGRGDLTAIFADDSLGWHGILDIGLWDGVPHLNTAVKETSLDGFTPPNNDLSTAIQYPTLSGYRYPSVTDDEHPE